MSHVRIRLGTLMNESWHTYEWVMAHVWMSHGTRMNESWQIYKCVIAHVWMSHNTHKILMVMSHVSMSHVTRINESCHTYQWVMSHVSMSHVTLIQDLILHERRLPRQLHARHVAWEWGMLRIWISDVTQCHSCAWVVAPLWMSHVTLMNESCHTYGSVMSHVSMSHFTVNESCHVWLQHVTYE